MGMFSVTAEMHDSKLTADKGDNMDRIEVLKTATADELKEANPSVVSEMVDSAVAEKTSELETVVSEMADVRTALGLEKDGSVVETISEMTERLQGFELDSQLRDKVEVAPARKVIKQLVISEMASGLNVPKQLIKC